MGLGAKLLMATVGGLGVIGTGFAATAAVTGPAGSAPAPVITLDSAAVRENQAAATARDTASAAQGAVGDTISVDVAPGPLTVLEPPAAVHLQRVAGTDEFRGAVHGLRMVDARGTNAGWKLSVAVTGIVANQGAAPPSLGPVAVHVDRIVAFARSTAGLEVAPVVDRAAGRDAPFLSATPGTGTGAFDLNFDVTVPVPSARGNEVDAGLRFTAA